MSDPLRVHTSVWADDPGRADRISAVVSDLKQIFAGLAVEFTTTAPARVTAA